MSSVAFRNFSISGDSLWHPLLSKRKRHSSSLCESSFRLPVCLATILANNDWESVANDSLLIVQKTKEGISLAPLPSINVASFHRVR